MKTDSAFETLIEILSMPVLILLEEQEKGVDIVQNPSIVT